MEKKIEGIPKYIVLNYGGVVSLVWHGNGITTPANNDDSGTLVKSNSERVEV